jgi:hypothetical protein
MDDVVFPGYFHASTSPCTILGVSPTAHRPIIFSHKPLRRRLNTTFDRDDFRPVDTFSAVEISLLVIGREEKAQSERLLVVSFQVSELPVLGRQRSYV